jgi:phytoene desaturase
VIGSGVAGLAISTRLAIQGYDVSVYERNSTPGGKLGMFQKDGYQFDTGPSLFTVPENIEQLFNDAGEDIRDYFQYEDVSTTCKYFFENGSTINAYSNPDEFAKELEQKVGEPAANLHKYLEASKNLYKYIGSIFLNFSLQKRTTWLHKRLLLGLAHLKYAYLFRTLNSYNSKRFKTREAQQIFNRFATYNGSDPFKAPAMLSVIPHLEFNQGVFYPKGGMISITNALYKLAQKKGVQFFMDTPVHHIIYADERARGIVVNGKNIEADVVVSNADVYFTWKNLIGRSDIARKVSRPERSSSALVFYWGINRSFDELDLHNIFFSKNYQQEFDHIFKKRQAFADPTIYINVTSKYDPSHAPAGKENWFVMINMPANYGQDWDAIKEQVRKAVIDKLSLVLKTDIATLIESETVLDPILIEQHTGSYMGALYGSSSNSKMAAFKRPANYTSHVKNLYFCGGTVHPGGGIPLCLKSAQITASLIETGKGKYKTKH